MNFDKIINNTVLPHILHTTIAAIVIFILSLIIFILFKHKLDSAKQVAKFRSRLTYISVCIFAVTFIQIWIEGLAHIFTMLGLVAAGLVVSNKETIMNLAGFLIINWRGVFTEGDYIQVQNHVGYVGGIHALYFKIYETTALDHRQATGKIIKVPNSVIITNSTVTFTPETSVVLQQLKFILDWDSDTKTALNLTETQITSLLKEHYGDNKHFSSLHLFKKNKALGALVNLKPEVYLKLPADKSKGLLVCIDYYTYAEQSAEIESHFWQKLQDEFKQTNIKMFF